MIKVLSREADRSMLGLKTRQSASLPLSLSLSSCVCSLLKRGSQAGDPAGVALEGAAKNKLLGHVDLWRIAAVQMLDWECSCLIARVFADLTEWDVGD